MKEVAPERRAVRGLDGGAGADGQHLVRARPVKRDFGPEYLGVSVRLPTLADGRGRIEYSSPTTHSEGRCWTQRVGEGGGSAASTGNGEGVVFADNVVRLLLPSLGQFAIIQVVKGQTLVSHDACAIETRQEEPWKFAHVGLVGRQTRRRADGVVLSQFYVGQMQVQIVLLLVDDYSQHLCHSVFTHLMLPVQLIW